MRQFGTAKAVFGFFITVGWIIAALSVILFIYILFKLGFETIVALSCCLLFVSGIFTVAAGQMGLAQIATAENTAAILAALTQNNQKIDLQQVPSLRKNKRSGFLPSVKHLLLSEIIWRRPRLKF